jgi:hypothetical protein
MVPAVSCAKFAAGAGPDFQARDVNQIDGWKKWEARPEPGPYRSELLVLRRPDGRRAQPDSRLPVHQFKELRTRRSGRLQALRPAEGLRDDQVVAEMLPASVLNEDGQWQPITTPR